MLQLLVRLCHALLHDLTQVWILHRSCDSLFVVDLLIDCKHRRSEVRSSSEWYFMHTAREHKCKAGFLQAPRMANSKREKMLRYRNSAFCPPHCKSLFRQRTEVCTTAQTEMVNCCAGRHLGCIAEHKAKELRGEVNRKL